MLADIRTFDGRHRCAIIHIRSTPLVNLWFASIAVRTLEGENYENLSSLQFRQSS